MSHPTGVRSTDRFAFYGVRLLAQTGQGVFLAALFLASGRGHSGALGVSSVFAATLAASVIFALPGGALADRLGAPRGLALGSLLRLVAIAGTMLVIGRPSLVWMAAFAYSAGSQLFSAAEMAMVPVVQRGGASRAHSVLLGLQYAGQAVGVAALAPALLLLGGVPALLCGAVAIYLALNTVTAVLAWRLSRPSAWSPLHAARRAGAVSAYDFGTTLRFLSSEPRALYAIGLLTFADIAMKSIVIAVPRYFHHDLGFSTMETGILFGFGVAGAVLGLLWSAQSLSLSVAPRVMRLALAGTVACVFALVSLGQSVSEAFEHSRLAVLAGVSDSAFIYVIVVAPIAFILGLCYSTAPTGARAVLTDTAPDGQQARVFAAQGFVSHAMVILPLVLTGAATQYAGARASLFFVAIAGLIITTALESARVRLRRPAVPAGGAPMLAPAVVESTDR